MVIGVLKPRVHYTSQDKVLWDAAEEQARRLEVEQNINKRLCLHGGVTDHFIHLLLFIYSLLFILFNAPSKFSMMNT